MLAVMGLCGCASMNSDDHGRVLETPGQELVDLSPDDVARIMLRAGFTHDQILDLGPDLRDALAGSGAAGIRMGEWTEAMVSVSGQRVYVSTRRRGSFVYQPEAGAQTQPQPQTQPSAPSTQPDK